jgi:hypothetical protein
MDTEDASAINTLSSLPVKNCKPLKIKCVDTTLRFDAKSKSQFPGPVLMGWFQAGGLYHGTGEYVGSDNAVSCKRTLTKFFTDEYDARRLVLEEGFTPNVASPAQQDAIFAKYPTWRAEFLNSQGQLIAKPFTVSPPFDNGQMATFVLTPVRPSLTPPREQRNRLTGSYLTFFAPLTALLRLAVQAVGKLGSALLRLYKLLHLLSSPFATASRSLSPRPAPDPPKAGPGRFRPTHQARARKLTAASQRHRRAGISKLPGARCQVDEVDARIRDAAVSHCPRRRLGAARSVGSMGRENARLIASARSTRRWRFLGGGGFRADGGARARACALCHRFKIIQTGRAFNGRPD